MHYIIKYDSQLYGRTVTCLEDVISGTPKKFPNLESAKGYAKRSCFTRPQFIKQKD